MNTAEIVETATGNLPAADNGDAPDSHLLNKHQLAARLGITTRTVETLVANGELPHGWAVGGSWRWRWSDVLAHIQARQHPGRRCRPLPASKSNGAAAAG